MQQYTNAISSTVIHTLKNSFPAECWANADTEELQFLNSHIEDMKDRSLQKMAGSQLDNGDVIVSTAQNLALLCQLDDTPAMHVDFLSPPSL
ncbi:hypothetical protein ACQYRI_10220 [Salmonella enterica]